MPLPFSSEIRGRFVTLWLDTPGASVNVLGVEAAQQLNRWMDRWERAARPPQWIMIRSKKPDSFINGAGLLMASTLKTVEKAQTVTAPVRAMYDRWARLKIPTIAWIEGNCFGCGLEFAIACRYRVAVPSEQTLFRMTEVSDYRFIPLFGGTYRLPRLVGAKPAAALLLGHEVWDSEQALASGLVDGVVSGSGHPDEVATKVSQRVAQSRRSRLPRSLRVPSEFWTAQPPSRRPLYQACAKLIERGLRGSVVQASRRERLGFAQTVTASPAQNAMRFFFVRHMARSRMLGTSQRARGTSVIPPREIQIWFPLGDFYQAPCEVRGRNNPRVALLNAIRDLDYRGYAVVPSFGHGPPAGARLIRRLRRVCEAFLRLGHRATALERAFWAHGFETPLRTLVPALTKQRTGTRRTSGARFVQAVKEGLIEECVLLLKDGTLTHPSHADVLASTLVRFPVERGSLLLEAEQVGAVRNLLNSTVDSPLR